MEMAKCKRSKDRSKPDGDGDTNRRGMVRCRRSERKGQAGRQKSKEELQTGLRRHDGPN